MKKSQICPKCEGRKTYWIEQVQQTYCDAQGTLRSFDLTGANISTGEKGLLGGDKRELTLAGPMSASVCATCGYTEWYASRTALEKLSRMAGHSFGAVRLIEAP